MQKILKKCFVILLMLICVNVKALECTKVYGPYLDKANEEYNLLDKEDSKDEIFYEKYRTNNFNYLGSETIYKFKRVKDINFITLYEVFMNTITDIHIYDNGKEISYEKTIDSNNKIKLKFKDTNPLNIKLVVEKSGVKSIVMIEIGHNDLVYATTSMNFEKKESTDFSDAMPTNDNVFENYTTDKNVNGGRSNILCGSETRYKYSHKLYHSYKLDCKVEPKEDKTDEKENSKEDKNQEKNNDNSKEIQHEDKIQTKQKKQTQEEIITQADNAQEIYQVPNTYMD